jgi:hypothetical protein
VLWRVHRRTEDAVVGTLIIVMFDRALFGLRPLRQICIVAIMLGTVLFLRRGLFEIPAQFRAWREKKKTERCSMPEEARRCLKRRAKSATSSRFTCVGSTRSCATG